MSGGVFIGQLFIQKDFKQPACWWVGLCSFPVGCLAWGVPALEPLGCWLGPGLGEKMVPSERAHSNEYSPELLPPVSLSPQWAPASAGDPPILAGKSGPVSYEVTAFSPGSWCTWDPVCAPKSGVSVSPSPMEFLQSNPAGLQSQILWGLLLPLPDPQAGEPDMGLRAFTPVGELLWYNYLPVCGSPTQHVWDLILSQLHPSYCLVVASSLSLDVGYLFW